MGSIRVQPMLACEDLSLLRFFSFVEGHDMKVNSMNAQGLVVAFVKPWNLAT